jgi:hypothetical protein
MNRHPLIAALLKARNSGGHVTYKEAKALLGEEHMCRAFGRMNELATVYYVTTGDLDLFAHVHNGKGPGNGYYTWKARTTSGEQA